MNSLQTEVRDQVRAIQDMDFANDHRPPTAGKPHSKREGFIQIKEGGINAEGKKESGIKLGSNMEVLEWEVIWDMCIIT